MNIPTLVFWRSSGDLIKTFKIISGLYDSDCTESLFRLREDDTTRGHSKRIFKTGVMLDLKKHSCPHRVVNDWNNLQESVNNVNSVSTFEPRLENFWKNQDLEFNYKAKIDDTTRSQRQVTVCYTTFHVTVTLY